MIIEYGKLKAAESQRSVSEFICATRLDPCEGSSLVAQTKSVPLLFRNDWKYTTLHSKKASESDESDLGAGASGWLTFFIPQEDFQAIDKHPWHAFPLQTVELALHAKDKLVCNLFLHRSQANSCTARMMTEVYSCRCPVVLGSCCPNNSTTCWPRSPCWEVIRKPWQKQCNVKMTEKQIGEVCCQHCLLNFHWHFLCIFLIGTASSLGYFYWWLHFGTVPGTPSLGQGPHIVVQMTVITSEDVISDPHSLLQ